jgi:hypothetical protein
MKLTSVKYLSSSAGLLFLKTSVLYKSYGLNEALSGGCLEKRIGTQKNVTAAVRGLKKSS